jgi:hypothetical protein
MSSSHPKVSWVQRKDLTVGKQYLVERGHRRRRVTLLDKTSATLSRGYVEVEFHEGVKAGEKAQVFCGSVAPLPGNAPEPPKPQLRKAKRALWLIAPDDWDPRPGETVTWSQTGEIRLEVMTYNSGAKVAAVRGRIFGVMEEYKAPRIELAPVTRQLETAEEGEGWAEEPYEEESFDTPEPREPAGVVSVEHDDLIDRLTFSPNCIKFYRRQFAKRASMAEADRRLRTELRKAEMVRPRTTGDYLRFRRPGRFDVILKRRPVIEDPSTTYITSLFLPTNRARARGVKGSKKAA